MSKLLVTDIGELVTLAPLAKDEKLTAIASADLGRISNAWLAVDGGKVAASGSNPVPASYQTWPTLSAKKGLVMPGLVDAHTHPIFAGSRAHEFCERLGGATYQDIAAKGGGIRYTVKKTREASAAELKSLTSQRLETFKKRGVTTVEAKSGYGLSVQDELKLLRILNEVKESTSQHMEITCLALHAVPPEAKSLTDFVKDMTENLLPEVAREKLAGWADAFVEEGYFSVEDAAPYIEKAKKLGFGLRLHADEFTDSKAALAAAAWGASSADHLEKTPREALKALADKKVVAMVLPGTSLYSKIPYADARAMREAGCPIAVATDFNPGSSVVDNLAMMATVAALHSGLDLPHAVAAVTYVPAYSLKLHQSKGALATGFSADFIIYDYPRVEEWLAGLGQKDPWAVYIGGRRQ